MNSPSLDFQAMTPVYPAPSVVFSHGQGTYLFDGEGRRYLDFSAGIAVNALGHADPGWVEVVRSQAGRLTHVSNLFGTEAQVRLAQDLTAHSFADRVFFSNSGSEANEAALKFARRWAGAQSREGKTKLVAFEGGFHGRTLGALSLTAKSKYRKPFEPLVPGVVFAPFNDPDAAEGIIDDGTCAVFVEPVQGEGGVNTATPEFLRSLRQLCDRHQALLVFDEVQCGLGRTGELWAHLASGVRPDIMTLAKPLAGGLPIGATLTTDEVAAALHIGDHGSTFGGGPLVSEAARYVFGRLSQPELLESVRQQGGRLYARLRELKSQHIVEVRGRGLMLGVEFDHPVADLIRRALQSGLIVINAGEHVLRICPPLIVRDDEIDEGMAILADALSSWEAAGG